jgi:raffinose/stachyose/melibiose transport system substrate-binding protein
LNKALSISTAGILSLALIAGCSGGSTNTANTGTNQPAATKAPEATSQPAAVNSEIKGTVVYLTHRTDMIGKEYNDYEKRFEAKYPGVDLKFEAILDYEKNSKIRISSGNYPDVINIPVSIPNNELNKYFAPLDDIKFSSDIYFPDYKSDAGKRYGISSGNSTVGIVYNKKAFSKAGITTIPKTYTEFLAAAQKLKDAGIVPLASNFKDKWPLDAWVYDVPTLVTGSADHQNKRSESDAPYAIDGAYGKAWSILRELKEKGYLEKDINSTNWEQSKKDVAQGKFAMYLLGNWVINQVIENGAASEDIGFFPFPVDDSGQLKAPLNPDWFYAANKNGNVPAAKAFIQFMIEESGFDEFAGFIPTLKSKQPKLAQLAEFNNFNPKFIESLPNNNTANEIQNKAQIDQNVWVQNFVLAKDPKVEMDKLNKSWSDAKKALGK